MFNHCLFQLLICLPCVQREDVEMKQKFLYATPSSQKLPSTTVIFPVSVLGEVFSAILCLPAEEYQE